MGPRGLVLVMQAPRSPFHQLVSALALAFERLSLRIDPLNLERLAFSVHESVSSVAREFHTHEHVLQLANDADPIGTFAALYHDLVYVQVDQGLPAPFRGALAPLLAPCDGGWSILPGAGADADFSDVLAVFGRKVGDTVTPNTGLNEMGSAFMATLALRPWLNRSQRLAVSACIEATIPFRESVGEPLVQRLGLLGLRPEDVARTVRLAIRVANADVANFAAPDPTDFLDNTWKLLPEGTPALQRSQTVMVSDYRAALLKMESFLAALPPERVFHRWESEPSAMAHTERIEAARYNIDVAVRYLRQKLYSISVVEALCVATGGDVPLDYVMGGIAQSGDIPPRRIEQYLTRLPSVRVEPELHRLLVGGRSASSRFDTARSPLAAFLHAALGEEAVLRGVERAKRWWAGEGSALDFLKSQPAPVVVVVARAAGQIADTRAEALRVLADRLETASPAGLES
jgi:hypothetical protein